MHILCYYLQNNNKRFSIQLGFIYLFKLKRKLTGKLLVISYFLYALLTGMLGYSYYKSALIFNASIFPISY